MMEEGEAWQKITLKRFRLYVWKYVLAGIHCQHIVLIPPVTAHINNNDVDIDVE